MPEPIRPIVSHGGATDPNLAGSLIAQVKATDPLSDDDYEHLFQTSLESKEKATKVAAFLNSNNVSQPERDAFYAYVTQKTRNADPAKRQDYNIASTDLMNLSPEDALIMNSAAGAAKAGGPILTQAMRKVLAGSAPIVKYEVAKHGLQYAGVPAPIATILAAGASGYRRAGVTEAAEQAGPTAAEDLAARLERGELRQAAPDTRIVRGADGRPLIVRPPAGARLVEQRAAATAAQPPASATVVPVPATPPETPPASASAAAPAAIPTAATNRLTIPAAKFNPQDAFTAVRQQFATVGETVQRGELTNAMELMRRGNTAEEAVAKVLAKRPAPSGAESAAEELARRLQLKGAVSDQDVIDIVTAKNAKTSRVKGGSK